MSTSICTVVAKIVLFCGAFGALSACSKDEAKEPVVPPVKISVNVSNSVNRGEVSEFRPNTIYIDTLWYVPYNLERTFTFESPKSIPDEYLTLIVDDYDIERNPSIVSNQQAKWAVVKEFVGYKNDQPKDARIKPVLKPQYTSYMLIYVDRDVKLDGDLGVFNNIKHAWGATLRKGWNKVTSQKYSGDSNPYLWYTNAPVNDNTTWEWK